MHRDVAIVRGCGCALHLRPKVDVVLARIGLATWQVVTEHTFTSLAIVVVIDVEVSIPGGTNEVVFLLSIVGAPEDET